MSANKRLRSPRIDICVLLKLSARFPAAGQALLIRLLAPVLITNGASIAQATLRPVGISPYLVACPLGITAENP